MGWSGFRNSPGVGSQFQSEVSTVKLVELMFFPCHRKYNDDTYTCVAGCMQHFNNFKVIAVCLYPVLCIVKRGTKITWRDSKKLYHFPEVGILLRSMRRLHHFPKVLTTSALVFAPLFAVETFFVLR